jgi:hypothetical protein
MLAAHSKPVLVDTLESVLTGRFELSDKANMSSLCWCQHCLLPASSFPAVLAQHKG